MPTDHAHITNVKPKPIIKTGHIIACLAEPPRFLCKDRKHGHYVVTLDERNALTFEHEVEAREGLEDYERSQGWNHHGAWAVYRMNSKITFEAAAA